MDGQQAQLILAKLRSRNDSLKRHIEILEREKTALEKIAQEHVQERDAFKQQAESWKRAWQDLEAILQAQSRKRKRGEHAHVPTDDHDTSETRADRPHSNVSRSPLSASEAQGSMHRVHAVASRTAKDSPLHRRPAMNIACEKHPPGPFPPCDSIHERDPAVISKDIGSTSFGRPINAFGRPINAFSVERKTRSDSGEAAESKRKKPDKRYPPLAPTVVGAGLRDADLPMMFRTIQTPLFGQR